MRTICRGFLRPRAGSAHDRTVRQSSRFPSALTNLSTADLVPMHSGEDWIVLLDDDISQPSAVIGSCHRELFRPGWRLRPYAQSCDGCGIIVITLQWTTVGSYGGRGAHRVLYYSCWYLNPAQPVCHVRQEKIANWTTSSVGKYSDRSSLGSYCDGHFGRL